MIYIIQVSKPLVFKGLYLKWGFVSFPKKDVFVTKKGRASFRETLPSNKHLEFQSYRWMFTRRTVCCPPALTFTR